VPARISDGGSGTAVAWKVPVGAVLSIMKKPAVVLSDKPTLMSVDPVTGPIDVERLYAAKAVEL
jgi:hypothetical protein